MFKCHKRKNFSRFGGKKKSFFKFSPLLQQRERYVDVLFMMSSSIYDIIEQHSEIDMILLLKTEHRTDTEFSKVVSLWSGLAICCCSI